MVVFFKISETQFELKTLARSGAATGTYQQSFLPNLSNKEAPKPSKATLQASGVKRYVVIRCGT